MANISIQEGNQGKQFGHINKLKISNQGGGTSLWVPEDEVKTKSLYVSENGTYFASKDEVYGYDEVTVNITKEVVGWKYDEETGELDGLYDIEVDDDDYFVEDDEGEIGEELPISIEIIQPPDKIKYKTGTSIDITGIKVKAYLTDGSEYETGTEGNIIPIEELSFDPTTADSSQSEGESAISDLDTNWEQPIPLYKTISYKQINSTNEDHYQVLDGGTILVHCNTDKKHGWFEISRTSPIRVRHWGYNGVDSHDVPIPFDRTDTYNGTAVTINGKTAYYMRHDYVPTTRPTYENLVPAVELKDQPDENTIWTAVYGTILDAGQEITVSWMPSDVIDEELTDTFRITVVASNTGGGDVEGGEGGGGSGGGSW